MIEHNIKSAATDDSNHAASIQVGNLRIACQQALYNLGCHNQESAQKAVTNIFDMYNSEERHYHDLTHICSMFKFISRFEDHIQNKDELVLAILFHDAVYDSKASDNELKSAQLAEKMLLELQVSLDSIDRIKSLILSTKDHKVISNNFDNAILLDADLAILAANHTEYLNYAYGIRQEYSWVNEEDYRVGRLRVLNSFLRRDNIFQEVENQVLLQRTAIENIKMEIQTLTFKIQ